MACLNNDPFDPMNRTTRALYVVATKAGHLYGVVWTSHREADRERRQMDRLFPARAPHRVKTFRSRS